MAATTGSLSTCRKTTTRGEKTFLGHTGNFSGEDIIDIVCAQPATARFIARHLYNFFVAEEPAGAGLVSNAAQRPGGY